MVNSEEITKILVTTACSFGLLIIVYNFVESIYYNGFSLINPDKKLAVRKEGGLTALLKVLENEDIDNATLRSLLDVLLEYTAFTEAQNCIGERGFLPKISALMKHRDTEVQRKTALVLNNLVLNQQNQERLREDCIPLLFTVLSKSECGEVSAAVLSVLVNFTTLDESHLYILPHMTSLYQLLQQTDVFHFKLQVLRILVNLSTNKKICENKLEFDAQLLRCMESYLSRDVSDDLVLRAATCCANVLSSLQRRWRYGEQPSTVATPEFVSVNTQDNLLRLSLHENEDIRIQARRCVAALNTPPTPSQSSHSMDSLDVLEVLKL